MWRFWCFLGSFFWCFWGRFFHVFFCSFLGRFREAFWELLGCQNPPKTSQVGLKTALETIIFEKSGFSRKALKTNEKPIKMSPRAVPKRPKILPRPFHDNLQELLFFIIVCVFDFCPFWVPFWLHLGPPFGPPKLAQVECLAGPVGLKATPTTQEAPRGFQHAKNDPPSG